MAFMGDKDISGSLEILQKSSLLNNSLLCAVPVKNNPRAATPKQICSIAKESGITATPFENLKDAYQFALEQNKPTILCGSLYLYKDFVGVLENI